MRARLKVSRAGVELIKSFEGLRTTAARLPDGRWTLGYGHTFSAREGATATQEDADALLRFDLLPIVDAINNVVLVPLNQNQFDSLVSFCFNIGVDNFAASSVCKRINEGRMTEAAQAMDSWRSAEFNGQTYVLAPLIRRRAAEKNLFLTPEDTVGNAPSLLIRPVEDAGQTQATPSEVEAPNHGGILSARPSGLPESVAAPVAAPVVETAPTSFTPPFEISATPQPVPAASVTPERQLIDLNAFAPRPVEVTPEPAPVAPVAKPTIQVMADVSPAETVVEQLPHGLMSTGAIRETPAAPVVEQTPTAYDYDPTPAMSPDVHAALARAQDEQRLREETQRQAEALAAARMAEEARQREEMRQREEARLLMLQQEEAARLEQQRLEQEQRDRLAREEQMRAELARLEQARLDQARLEQARLEQARLEQAAAEQAAAEQARLEQTRLEQARLEQERQEAQRLEAERAEITRQEQVRAEVARLEQERMERERQDALRLEAERAEAARQEHIRQEQAREDQIRAQQARMEQARLEQEQAERLEAERAERERQDAAQREQARLEQEKAAQAAAAAAAATPAPSAEDAEKQRKAEAAAALMRLYSPYGSGGLGRPLTPSVLPKADAGPALEPNPAPRTSEPVQQPAPQPVYTPEPPKAQAPAPVPQPVVVTPDEDEDDDSEVHVVSETVSFAFKPAGSASQMPPPQVTALNPYARPIPQNTETFIEVPRPAAVDLTAPSLQPQLRQEQEQAREPVKEQPKTESLHWREQLQRPLPPGYQSSEPSRPAQTAAPAAAAAAARPSRLDDAFETDEWTMGGERIALSVEEMEEETVSFWRMLSSTTWWILVSAVGLGCLGGAAAFYIKATKDDTVIRNGLTGDYSMLSVIAAAAGIFFVCVSVWLIMKRLGGLKD